MTDFESAKEAFLTEIRETGDALAILAYADWLEEQGRHSCEVLRAIESRLPINKVCDLAGVRNLADVIRALDREMQATLSFNFGNHVLPWFENMFPEDQHPRIAIELARRIGTLEKDSQPFQSAVEAAKSADRRRWNAVSAFCNSPVDPRAALRVDRDAAFEAKKTAIASGVASVEKAEAAFFAARTVVYICQGTPLEHVARSAAFAYGKSKAREEEWQLRHAIKILHLGEIPLTEAESTEYVQ